MFKISIYVFLLFFIPCLISKTNKNDKIIVDIKLDIDVAFNINFIYLSYLDKDNKIKRFPKIYSSDTIRKNIRIDTVFNILNENLNSDKIAFYLIILSEPQDGFGYSFESLDTFSILNETVKYLKKLDLSDFRKEKIIE